MKIKYTINAKLPGLTAVIRSMEGGKLSGPAFDTMRTQWAARYSAFAHRRYGEQSKGGGDWPALAASTIKARRGPDKQRAASRKRTTGKVGPRVVSILIDTGVMRQALRIGAVGNLVKGEPKGIVFGFAGGVPHPVKPKASTAKPPRSPRTKSTDRGTKLPRGAGGARGASQRASIAQIAGYHNAGGGTLPQRLILARPDAQTAKGMSADLLRAITNTARAASKAGAR